jgi:hypothetical protein
VDHKAFSLMAAMAGLELSESDSRELYEYSRQLFAILKSQPKQDSSEEEETQAPVTRVFGKHRSILELKLGQVEPALFFGVGHASEE